MKVLILTTNYSFQVSRMLDQINTDGHEIEIWHDGKCEFSEVSNYDIGISFMYQHKVPAKEVNSHTWFNFHPAPLPEYKGRNLCYHAIMNGETEFGATLHYMDEGFDTGDIIEVFKFTIPYWYTAQDLSETAINISKSTFVEFLPMVLEGRQFERKPNVGGHYYKKEPIEDCIGVNEYQDRKIRAITYGSFYPKIDIGGVTYKIVRDE